MTDARTDVATLREQLAAQVAASDAQLASMAGQLEAARQQLAAAAKQSNNGLLDGEAETLRRGAELSAARTAQLEKELAAAKASLEAYQGAPSAAEHDDLKRLYQDALRARDFYQKRAAELEKQSAGGQPDAGEPPR